MNLQLESILKNELNEQQYQAINNIDGPLLVIAGAGTGKTKMLTYRIINIILKKYADPQDILAITFTNKAANEMKNRTFQLLKQFNIFSIYDIWFNTFHSFGLRILKQHISHLNYNNSFVIYNGGDQLKFIKKILKDLNINEKIYNEKFFSYYINKFKLEALDYKNALEKYEYLDQIIFNVFDHYQKQMQRNNILDFSDLLLKTYELFTKHNEILKYYQNKFKYILIDEYQDTNHLQYLIIKMLTGINKNICAVGDEDQSIYSWRGADISNILNFEKDFPNAKIIKLEENYRSTQTIIKASSHLINNNFQRKEKTLFTQNEIGEKIEIYQLFNEYQEAQLVSDKIQSLINHENFNLSDIAIFYRTNAQSRIFEEEFIKKQINYKIVGGTKFYDRMEIKDILAYFRLILNPDDDLACKRIINVPIRGIGKTTLNKIDHISLNEKISFYEACKKSCKENYFNTNTQEKISSFINLIEKFQQNFIPFKDPNNISSDNDNSEFNILKKNHSVPPSKIFREILNETGYLNLLRIKNNPETESRIENLKEFENALLNFENRNPKAGLDQFLEEISLITDIDNESISNNEVTLMTFHIAKGLEFPIVFMVGMEQGLFPLENSEDNDLEEERRLAYVGMTRAKKKLFLTYAQCRRVWGTQKVNDVSSFISEIPEDYYILFKQPYPNTYNSNYNELSNNWNSKKYPNLNKHNNRKNHNSLLEDSHYNESREWDNMKGKKIYHPIFGKGTILSSEGSGDEQKLKIIFQNKNIKKFITKYANLKFI